MTEFNAVKLTGDIMSVTKSGFVLKVENQSANGETYTELITCLMPAKAQHSWMKIGAKVSLKGKLDQKADKQVVSVLFADETPDAEYLNIVRLIGKVRYPFQYWSKSEGKQPFGNLAVGVAKMIFRGVLFGALATTFSRVVKRGQIVQLQGFLRNRSFETRTGEKRSALEIIADPDWCEILSAGEDEFADFDESPIIEAEGAAF